MYGKILFNLIFIVFLSLIQVSFVSSLPGWFSYINIPVVFLVLFLILIDLRIAINWAIGFGIVMDLYSFSPFGYFMSNYIIIVVLTYLLLVNFFTNRSLYSLLTLTLFALFTSTSLKYIFYSVYNIIIGNSFFANINNSFFLNEVKSIFVNLIFVALLFYLINIITLRFKPVLLIRPK